LTGLGSTDIGAIMGMNAYKTALDVFEDKLEISFKITETNELMQLGKDAEPYIRDDFNKKFGTNYNPLCVQKASHNFLIGSLDGFDSETNTILEIKYSKYAKMSNCIKQQSQLAVKEIYPQYYCQIQYFLYLTGAEKGFLASYDLDGQLVHMSLERDEELIKDMVKAGVDFWNNHILTKTAPNDIKNGYVFIDDEEATELADKLESVETRRKERAVKEKEDKALSDSLKSQLVEFSDDGDFKCSNIYLKRIEKNKLNTKKLYEDFKISDEVLEEYKSKSIGYWGVSIA
jgi:putative phage-type endonuclease